MDGSGSGYRYGGGGERKVEIVSGSHGGARGRSPDLAPWKLRDPEMKRKKRIAKYKVYTVEGKVKASLRNGLRWIKNKCSQIVSGY